MIEKLFSCFKKKALPEPKEEAPKPPTGSQASAYTEEEARKVKERLQGLGYID